MTLSDFTEKKRNGFSKYYRLSDVRYLKDLFTYIFSFIEAFNEAIPIVPLTCKVLLSQNAPIGTTTDPTMLRGQIWTLDAYNVADAATIAGLELISGTLSSEISTAFEFKVT